MIREFVLKTDQMQLLVKAVSDFLQIRKISDRSMFENT